MYSTITYSLFSVNITNFNKTFKMASLNQNINIADYYFGFLKNLNSESKLDLIAKLSLSLKETEKKSENFITVTFWGL